MRGFLKKRTQLEQLDLLEKSLNDLLTMTSENKDLLFGHVDNDLDNLINSLDNNE
jgi:hypothetical protein